MTAPVRLDPWQNIVEVGWNSVRYAQATFDINGEDTLTGRDDGVCPTPTGQDFGGQYHPFSGDGIDWVWSYGEPLSKAAYKVKRVGETGTYVLDAVTDEEHPVTLTMPDVPSPIVRAQTDTDQVLEIGIGGQGTPGGLTDSRYPGLDLSDWFAGQEVNYKWERFVLDGELACVGPPTEPPGYLARLIVSHTFADPAGSFNIGAARIHYKDKAFTPIGFKFLANRITILFRKQV